jgi:hypothetical protein
MRSALFDCGKINVFILYAHLIFENTWKRGLRFRNHWDEGARVFLSQKECI